MLDRYEILITLPRFVQRVFENALAAIAKFVFVCT